ncbi:hypothetical protein SCHPADRAFT_896744 [Schizopora paradoxa]|uniref:Uncharacterized protein n=1 Tax=Schizopora paradoxa TaxID=27342 RepID=A0A0H2QZ17_9AGAM|nr:hypothetical protein SCHPADRAFT_896744 [Schizopora paradoxa]
MTTTMTATKSGMSPPVSRLPYTDEDRKLADLIRANIPQETKKHLVLAFKFDWDWALQKALQLYGDFSTDERSEEYMVNINKFRYHIIRESGIASCLDYYLTPITDSDGISRHEALIGLAENRKGRSRIPTIPRIRKLMELLETDEPPKWYPVAKL